MIISLGGYLYFLLVSFQFKSSDLALKGHFEKMKASRVHMDSSVSIKKTTVVRK